MVKHSLTRNARLDALAAAIREKLAAHDCELIDGFGELTLVVPAEQLLDVCWTLRDDAAFRFEQLIDLCGVDYAAYGHSEWETDEASFSGFGRGVDRDLDVAADDPKRFAVAVHLLSLAYNCRLRLRVYVGGNQPMVDSLIPVWAAANWFEREAFDLYGILFKGHPDLRRILTDYGFVGHPFRKDFPLTGQVEMRYDPEQKRVVYEPVSIEPRVLVPRVIRDDSRYVGDGVSKEAGDA
ncbi:NADH-quinone oxidoreductase subunit C [Thiorhodococcus mannitoliphagus]|uniref:NADH-quinone oxidoreductase subunit C n=1 Tax=Thiorhodococcus mannitoliphagus TaxID=329406 RepID=A0A6P1DVC4_9GAMM|nr:NADH-quinone oxidoreductase subunit C [Thiorhodococcus mannitoliphagus]NEX20931.1 NADH-quinone oxidoreductase subunit C [Thiorhodococcus mannitoliphagus]